MHTVRPNFFIIGAPRCGTTALSEYLRGHPKIGFSVPKEPNFFATDLPRMRLYEDEKSYLTNCFGHCLGKNYAAIGEGSVWHLYSEEAVSNILRFEPSAKFIVMIRNPIDMAIALYEKYCELLVEDQRDFELAWRMQDVRRKGMNVPKYCTEAKYLCYGDICKLGEQLERVFHVVPEEQRMVILFDDFIGKTSEIYRAVLDFLGLPNDGRSDFSRINEGKRIRNKMLWEYVQYPRPWALHAANVIKGILGIKRLNLLPKLRSVLLVQRRDKPQISSALREEMREYFAGDLRRLSSLLGRDFSCWK